MPQETELKLRIVGLDAPTALRRLRSSPALRGRAQQQTRLRNRYLDTPDHWLRTQRCALRLRAIQATDAPPGSRPRWVQTFKTAGIAVGGLSRRGEWEAPLRRAAVDPQALSDTPLAALDPDGQRLATLQPVFDTDFVRTAWTVRRRDGTCIEVALDVGEVRAGERRLPLLELELELLHGEASALFALAAELAQQVPLLPSRISKAERGYRLAKGESAQPQRAAVPALPRRATPAAIAQTVLPEVLGQLCANLEGLLDADAPEFVHQARVAWRRWRSIQRLLRPWLSAPVNVEPLNALVRLLGAVRDLDVARHETLPRWASAYAPGHATGADDGALATRQAALAQADGALRAQADRARCEARAAIGAPSVGGCLIALAAWLHDLPPGEAAPRHWAHQRLWRWHTQWQRLLKSAIVPGATEEAIHDARLFAKRLRYAADAVAGSLPARDARETRRWQQEGAAWQDRIGAVRDTQRCADLLRTLGAADDLIAFLQGAAAALSPARAA